MPQYVKVYHLSPNANIRRLRGFHSSKLKARGIFVSESWVSILNDWIGTLFSKRFGGGRKQSTMEKRRRKIRRLDDQNHDPELEKQYSKKLSRYNNHQNGVYQSLTIYQLSVPKHIFDICKQRHHELAQEAFASQGAGAIGAYGWGVETFLYEEYLSHVKIVGRQTYSKEEAYALEENHRLTRRAHRGNIYRKMETYRKEIEALIEVFGKAPLLDRALRYVSNIQWTDIEDASRHYKVVEDLIAPYRRQLPPRRNPDTYHYQGFHGTYRGFPDKDIKSFGGIHVGTYQAAVDRLVQTQYSAGGRDRAGKTAPGLIYSVSVQLSKPYGSDTNPVSETDLFGLVNIKSELQLLKDAGYDGIIYQNIKEDPGSISVLAFYRKSVIAQQATVLDVGSI